jgi:DeoR family deoxyribose operon repressor
MATRKRQDRLLQILDTLHQMRGASIRELSAKLGVSEMTIRRDLSELSAGNKVRLVHAGAVPAGASREGRFGGYSLIEGTGAGIGEKMRIGRKAASLVEPGDVLYIDSGPIPEWLARSIPPEMPVTILCYALNVLLEAGRGKARTLVLAGGALRDDTLVFESPEGLALLRRHRAGKAFLSAEGASARLGVTCADAGEAELKKAALATSRTRILLADSRAFGVVLPAWFADLEDFDAIITDPGISLEYVELLKEKGITLHVV